MIWDPSDCNPMHRRIPAEVVSRRPRVVKKVVQEEEKETDEVRVDMKAAAVLKPDARPKWLIKACKMVAESRASPTELYNIVVSRKFGAGLPERIGRKLGLIIRDNLELFSDKQQRFLTSSEFTLIARLVSADGEGAGDAEPEEPAAPAVSEEMLANSQALAREQAAAVRERERHFEEKERQEADKIARMASEAQVRVRREAAQREDRKRILDEEIETEKLKAAEEEAVRRKKLEEEADSIFQRALAPPPTRGNDRGRSRSVSAGSHSVSAPRRSPSRDKRGRRGWLQAQGGGAVSGSRAIFLNRDFVEDLPHMPRPETPGVRGVSRFDRSRSRSRERSSKRSRRGSLALTDAPRKRR
mmetsp:Transcript_10561/g.23783  ORF Transcript_10561/g.23783 Transcript_10561/m.23783 type:complete len:358 (-) Transcript_10561:69-1142(-)